MRSGQLHLGAILAGTGAGPNEWLEPDIPGDASVNINWYVEAALRAERAKFDFVFIVDSPFVAPESSPHFLSKLEPLMLMSALAVSTNKIGLVGTVTTSYSEPYNVARQLASLDLISCGRAGWNVVTTGVEAAANNYSRKEHFEHSVRYRRALEFVRVVQGLWSSYEEGAFPRNKESGIFFDKTKQHRLDHRGEFFCVAGPLNIERSVQGQPVIFQAGDSSEGRNLGAHIADATFGAANDFEWSRIYYSELKSRAAAIGRNPNDIRVIPGFFPILTSTDEEAKRKLEEREASFNFDNLFLQLSRAFGNHDFSKYDPDDPFPNICDLNVNSYKGLAERLIITANTEMLTLRQTAWRYGRWRSGLIGSPLVVANEIERWFMGYAADGFNVHIGSFAAFDLFVGEVLPILRKRGLFRNEYETSTLRGHLGLQISANLHTLSD